MDQKKAELMQGAYALMLTPYHEDLTVDYDAFERYADWQAARCKHLFAVCGSSEMAQLTREERVRLAALTAKHANGSFVVATANLEPTWQAQCEEVRQLEAAGVDGLVFTTKNMGNAPDLLVPYLIELAQQTTLPVMLYEFPSGGNHLISGETYRRLVESGRFYGIKDTTCTMEKIKEKIAVQGDSNVLQANIPLLYDAYLAGARGVMATPTTCAARLFQKMWDAFVAGDQATAARLHTEILLVDGALSSGFPSGAKYLMSKQGCDMLPLSRTCGWLKEPHRRALDGFYAWAKDYGILE